MTRSHASATCLLLLLPFALGSPTVTRAQQPDEKLPFLRWTGGQALDPLAVPQERPRLPGLWELSPLPTTSFEPGVVQEDSALKGGWRKEQILPITGPVFLFGQVQKGEEWMADPGAKMVGDTGVACKLPSLAGADLLFRFGPELTYDGAVKSADRSVVPVQPRWLRLDLQARWSVLGPLGVEWQGAACPGVADGERDRLIQDVRAVLPLGKSGQFQLGAKRIWENTAEPKNPWAEMTQFYTGFKIGW
jgi:hypothetical protein